MNGLTNDGLSNLKPQWPRRRGGVLGSVTGTSAIEHEPRAQVWCVTGSSCLQLPRLPQNVDGSGDTCGHRVCDICSVLG